MRVLERRLRRLEVGLLPPAETEATRRARERRLRRLEVGLLPPAETEATRRARERLLTLLQRIAKRRGEPPPTEADLERRHQIVGPMRLSRAEILRERFAKRA